MAKGVAEATGSNEADAKKAIIAVFDQIAAAAVNGPPYEEYEEYPSGNIVMKLPSVFGLVEP